MKAKTNGLVYFILMVVLESTYHLSLVFTLQEKLGYPYGFSSFADVVRLV